jgi:hypothetical protein
MLKALIFLWEINMETRLGGFWTKEIRKLEVLLQTRISLS